MQSLPAEMLFEIIILLPPVDCTKFLCEVPEARQLMSSEYFRKKYKKIFICVVKEIKVECMIRKTIRTDTAELHGRYLFYNKRGLLCINTRYRNGKLHGAYSFYNDDGTLCIDAHYKDGKLHGKYIVNHENGVPKEDTTYIDGVKQGKSLLYSTQGELLELIYYVDGQYEGSHILYYPAGKVKRIDNYVGGCKNGICVKYHENGKKQEEIFYNYDKAYKRSVYNAEGEEIRQCAF
jgi:antitoxin component YwqK of YwqJK toxin-antitoxin module